MIKSCPIIKEFLCRFNREGNACLSDRLQETKLENKNLRQVSTNFVQVRRCFFSEHTEVAVVTDKRREQAEKYESGLKGRNPVSVCDNYQKWIKFCRGRHNRSAPASAVTHVIHL